MNNMISRAGDAREDMPQSAIQEFKVIVSQAPAEYGGRVGGVVNVVTKSGAQPVRGEAFEFFRDKSLNRVDLYTQQNHDQLGTPIPDFRRDQFGGAVGGPLVKDRLHFFASFERTDDQQFFTVNTGKPQYYSALEGTFQGGSLANIVLRRGPTCRSSPSQHVFFRYFKQTPTLLQPVDAARTTAAFGSTDTGVPGLLVHRQPHVGDVAARAERVHGDVRRIVPDQHAERPLHAAAVRRASAARATTSRACPGARAPARRSGTCTSSSGTR